MPWLVIRHTVILDTFEDAETVSVVNKVTQLSTCHSQQIDTMREVTSVATDDQNVKVCPIHLDGKLPAAWLEFIGNEKKAFDNHNMLVCVAAAWDFMRNGADLSARDKRMLTKEMKEELEAQCKLFPATLSRLLDAFGAGKNIQDQVP